MAPPPPTPGARRPGPGRGSGRGSGPQPPGPAVDGPAGEARRHVPPVLGFESVVVEAPDGTEILRGVDLEVTGGRLTVLAGRSGSGKSTLLRLANRLEVPTRGVVRFHGEDIAGLDVLALRRRIGMVFQRPTPFPGTVADNLAVARPHVADRDGDGHGHLATVLVRVGLDPAFLDRTADNLSGGEAQRMCLARTLLTDPEVVLMDEPTSALDPSARQGIERLARDLVDGGLTVVWVTHDLDQARRIADDVAVLVDGRVADPGERAAYLAGPPLRGGEEEVSDR